MQKGNNKEKGQAIFELIIFLPILIFFLIVISNYGNSINASINQLKASRSYLFYLLKGNSMGIRTIDFSDFRSEGVQSIGNFIIGWRETSEGDSNSFGSCYEMPALPGNSTSDFSLCKDKIEQNQTKFIKIFTMYGICGETYKLDSGSSTYYPSNEVRHCSQRSN